jgi:hypothetical protein
MVKHFARFLPHLESQPNLAISVYAGGSGKARRKECQKGVGGGWKRRGRRGRRGRSRDEGGEEAGDAEKEIER